MTITASNSTTTTVSPSNASLGGNRGT
jgi:hypothetical protein